MESPLCNRTDTLAVVSLGVRRFFLFAYSFMSLFSFAVLVSTIYCWHGHYNWDGNPNTRIKFALLIGGSFTGIVYGVATIFATQEGVFDPEMGAVLFAENSESHVSSLYGVCTVTFLLVHVTTYALLYIRNASLLRDLYQENLPWGIKVLQQLVRYGTMAAPISLVMIPWFHVDTICNMIFVRVPVMASLSLLILDTSLSSGLVILTLYPVWYFAKRVGGDLVKQQSKRVVVITFQTTLFTTLWTFVTMSMSVTSQLMQIYAPDSDGWKWPALLFGVMTFVDTLINYSVQLSVCKLWMPKHPSAAATRSSSKSMKRALFSIMFPFFSTNNRAHVSPTTASERCDSAGLSEGLSNYHSHVRSVKASHQPSLRLPDCSPSSSTCAGDEVGGDWSPM